MKDILEHCVRVVICIKKFGMKVGVQVQEQNVLNAKTVQFKS